MRRFFLLFTALTTLLASCAKDDTATVIGNGETTVSFKVLSPKIQTRYGEGTTANKLLYAIYQNGVFMSDISAITLDKAVDITNLTADLQLALVNGLTYDILFWAQAENAPYTFDGAKVTFDYSQMTANEESYDAFFRNYRAKIDGTTPHTVELHRPFAQLNIGTGDIDKAKLAGFDLENTSITVEACTTLDLMTGVASESQEITFSMNGKTEDKYEGYDIIAMNYLLVNSEKEFIDVKFYAEGGRDLLKREYLNVPIQRNHRTYLLGDILTSTKLLHVYINPIFDGLINYTPPKEYAIYYTSTDGQIVKLDSNYGEYYFGANITGHTYKNGRGKITFDKPVTKIGDMAFSRYTTLESITIPDDVTYIGYNAFYFCNNLTSIVIPDKVTRINFQAFWNCNNLTKVVVGNSVSKIGEYAFTSCTSLKDLTIGKNVKDIDAWAFNNCPQLTVVTLPDGITKIGNHAFHFCTNLTSITIPDSVEDIGENAFYFCTNLTMIYCKSSTPPTGNAKMFDMNAPNRKILVPAEAVDDYKEAEYWSEYADNIFAEE